MGVRRLRPDLPFRRVAVILSGGGALGAYQIGVLRAIETLGLEPRLVAGVSIGALNAVSWIAHGLKAAPLERMWRSVTAAQAGLHWTTLGLSLVGSGLAFAGVLQVVLTVLGSRELSGAYWFWHRSSGRIDLASALLEVLAWALVAVAGFSVLLSARRAEDWLARLSPRHDPARGRRWLGFAAATAAALHALVWVFGWPWPHRFSAVVVLALTALWLGARGGWLGNVLRRLLMSLVPESHGRGLWGAAARRELLTSVVREGDPGRLMSGAPRLVIDALAVDSGRICHFVNWPDPSPEFVARVEGELGEVQAVRDPEDVIRAAVASSAVPGVFEPVRIGGRDFVDAGGFSNQPLHVAVAADADAAVVVLMAPSTRPGGAGDVGMLMELVGRLVDIANWRDMQFELRSLPAAWSSQMPAPIVRVEPPEPLPGSLLGFDPSRAVTLIEHGERDMWAALERAGWLEPDPVGA